MKRILSAEESRDLALETIKEISAPIKATLGPGGNPQIIQRIGNKPDGTPLGPLITKDGVTVAEQIILRDPAKNTITQAILQVAQNTVNQAGDGTTTAVVLAEAIYEAGYKYIKQGNNGIQLYNDLKLVKDQAIDLLMEYRKEITIEDIYDVALISSNGDEKVAQIVTDAIKSVGEDGHIALEEGYSKDTTLEKIQGAVYKQGWRGFGPHGSNLVNDQARNVAELNEPAILLYADKIDSLEDFAKIVKQVMGFNEDTKINESVTPFMIVAHDYSDDVKNLIIQMRLQNKIPIAAIKSPFDGSPNARTEMMKDMAVIVGAELGARGILDLGKMTTNHLGQAKRIEVGMEETVIYEGYGDSKELLQRVKDLKKLLENTMHDFDKENLQIRIGKLTGGIAIVRVGGDSELEMGERKDRIEDALCSAKVAISDGIVPGGGWPLYVISQILDGEGVAVKIMKEALQAPIKQIITNVGENPEVVISHMPTGKQQGYNARKKVYEQLMINGIIDPFKVTKSALENAVSIAGLLLTTGGAIVHDIEDKTGQVNPLAAMMGM